MLLDLLLSDHRALGELGEPAVEVASLQRHLAVLLNARQGRLPHIPGYGLPDVESLYAGLPYSQQVLAESVRQLVLQYEPRVRHAVTRCDRPADGSCVVRVSLQLYLRDGGAPTMRCDFGIGGNAVVIPEPAGK